MNQSYFILQKWTNQTSPYSIRGQHADQVPDWEEIQAAGTQTWQGGCVAMESAVPEYRQRSHENLHACNSERTSQYAAGELVFFLLFSRAGYASWGLSLLSV